MQLTVAQQEHIRELTTWFTSEAQLAQWSGPGFRYPFTIESFIEDLRMGELTSFALLSDSNELLAFGQYYERIGRCHLGRLVVSPNHRGKGIAAELMKQLCDKGMQALSLNECSLFVLADNDQAIKAYEKFGFAFRDYPEPIEMPHCVYMVKS